MRQLRRPRRHAVPDDRGRSPRLSEWRIQGLPRPRTLPRRPRRRVRRRNMTIIQRLYQRRTWDFNGVPNVGHRKILQGALDACEYNFWPIRVHTGKRVPVGVADLSRFAAQIDPKTGHAHIHNPVSGEVGHLLGMPIADPQAMVAGQTDVHVKVKLHEVREVVGSATSDQPETRQAALGLYWLPTGQFPAGRVEIDANCFTNPDLAREVFLAEGAHAVDYGALTEEQRTAIESLF